MKKLIIILCAIAPFVGIAQNVRVVKGAVFDDKDMPISGVSIKAVGSEETSQTDKNGMFSIQLPTFVKFVGTHAEGYLPAQLEIDGSYLLFKLKVDKKYQDNKAKAEAEAKQQAEAREKEELKRAEAAKLAAQKEAAAKAKAEEEAKLAAQKEAAAKAAAKAKAEEAARIAAQKEAAAKAKAEEEARIAAQKEAVAQARAKQEALLAEQKRIAAEKEAAERAEQMRKAKIEAEKRRAEFAKHKAGFGSILDLTYISGMDYKSQIIGVRYIAGYRFNNFVYFGAGVGVQYDFGAQAERMNMTSTDNGLCTYGKSLSPHALAIPIFAHFRANFLNRACSPFFALSVGGIISQNQKLTLDLHSIEYKNHKIFANPQVGLNFRSLKKTGFYLAVGAHLYNAPTLVEYTGYNATIAQKIGYSVDFHFGFTF